MMSADLKERNVFSANDGLSVPRRGSDYGERQERFGIGHLVGRIKRKRATLLPTNHSNRSPPAVDFGYVRDEAVYFARDECLRLAD